MNKTAVPFLDLKSINPAHEEGLKSAFSSVTTKDAELAQKIRFLLNCGSQRKYHNEARGYNCRLDELQAPFLRVKQPYLDAENVRRIEVTKQCLETFRDMDVVWRPTMAPAGID